MTSGEAHPDWLSMLGFDADYVSALLEIGEADAARHADHIAAFLEA